MFDDPLYYEIPSLLSNHYGSNCQNGDNIVVQRVRERVIDQRDRRNRSG